VNNLQLNSREVEMLNGKHGKAIKKSMEIITTLGGKKSLIDKHYFDRIITIEEIRKTPP